MIVLEFVFGLLLMLVKCNHAKHSGLYTECLKGQCRAVNDREVEWYFDQPIPIFIEKGDGIIRKSVEENAERLLIKYTH